MRFVNFLLFPFVLFSYLSSTQNENSESSVQQQQHINFDAEFVESLYQSKSIRGCFILYDVQNDTRWIYNEERVDNEFLPASTFKIPNSLIALECEVINNEDEVIAWDSVKRFVPAWNMDQNMKTAFRYSAVWFYQELARRIGQAHMQKYVRDLHYGNEKAGPEIDSFWLNGDLRISPIGQIEFLKRFVTGQLSVKKKHVNTVKDIMIVAKGDDYILRGKTGWATFGQPVGWYVGYLEIGGKTFIFVNNMDINRDEDAKQRVVIVKEILDKIFDIELNI